MCNNHRLHAHGAPSYHEGIDAIDYLLRNVYKVEVSKALNPLDDGDFLVISARLSEALRKAVAGEEGKALTAALNALDVDWRDLTAAGRSRVMNEVTAVLSGAVARTLPKIDKVLSTAGTRIATDTKVFADRKFKLQIGTSLNQADKASIDFLRRNTAMFVTDSSGKKIVSATNRAADIVSHGLERGLGSADITESLIAEVGPRVGRAESYWDVVSMAYTNDARSTTQMRSFQEAGIESYQLVAVRDEHTTPFCIEIDGKVFSVGAAVDLTNSLMTLEDPKDVKEAKPWIKEGRTDEGNRLLYIDKGGERRTVTEFDSKGGVRSSMSAKDMETNGLLLPPFHGLCRTTTIPV